MFKKIVAVGLIALMVAGANASVLANSNDGDKKAVPNPVVNAESRDWKKITAEGNSKAFDPASQKSTMAEYNQTKKAGKKFSITGKVLIGVGIAAAVVAIVFVAARKDLKDDILR